MRSRPGAQRIVVMPTFGVLRAVFLVLVAIAVAPTTAGAAVVDNAGSAAAQVPAGPAFATGANNAGQLGNLSFASPGFPGSVVGVTDAVAVASGQFHTVALRSDGTVWAWGLGTSGQLGNGTLTSSLVPVKVSGLTGVVAIAAGEGHSMALLSDGTVQTWGDNATGQLGVAAGADRTTAGAVPGLTNVVQIAAGRQHSMALGGDGVVRSWGAGGDGQLGNGAGANSATPLVATGLSNIVAVAAGENHSLALASSGAVAAWGDNTFGQVGDGTQGTDRFSPVVGVMASSVGSIAAGGNHSLTRLTNGIVFAWGRNASGQVGDNTTVNKLSPTPLSIFDVVAIAGLNQHSVAVRSDGTLWAWGENGSHELGDGTTTDRLAPLAISSLGQGAAAVGAGSTSFHTVGVAQPYASVAARFVRFGEHTVGTVSGARSVTVRNTGAAPLTISSAALSGRDADQFEISSDCAGVTVPGNGSCRVGLRFAPGAEGVMTAALEIRSNAPASPHVVEISGTGASELARRPHESVFAVGNNDFGQLGDGTLFSRSSLRQVAGLTGVVQLAHGERHTVALLSDGTVWAWGANHAGQLGDGTFSARRVPVEVEGLDDVVAIASGAFHTLALRRDGKVWAWGYNGLGGVGDGTTTDRSVPTLVLMSGGVTIEKIAAGGYHSLALRNGAAVLAWGKNSSGQLCDGSTTSRLSPVAAEVSGITRIGAGGDHSLFVEGGGAVRACGENSLGQLGDGTTTSSPRPVTVQGLTGPSVIAGGSLHTLALRSDGVYAWGHNGFGQLGDGTLADHATPQLVPGTVDATAIGVGSFNSWALLGDGTARGWGYNSYGQVGNGSTLDQASPVPVAALGNGVAALGSGFGYHGLFIAGPALTRSSTGSTYPLQAVGTTSTARTVTLANTGAAALDIDSVELTGADADQFELASEACAGRTLEPDETCTFSTRFRPTVPGRPAASVRIESNAPSSPDTVALAGAAIAPLAAPEHATEPGPLLSTGFNDSGQLGDGTTAQRTTPAPVPGLDDTVGAAAGAFHSGALRDPGTLSGFGRNTSGQLGIGNTVGVTSPFDVPLLSGMKQVASGSFHTVALRSDGTVWTYGFNGSGQLGIGSTTQSITPVQVLNLANVVEVAAGNDHSLARRSDGSVWAWGLGASGQLGNGFVANQTQPVQVTGLTGVKDLAAGQFHSLAVRSDGTVAVWGNGGSGRLGNGTSGVNSPTAVTATGITTATDVAGGSGHSLARLADGTLRAWGANGSGQLGDGTITNRTTPVAVGVLTNVEQIAGGAGHSLARRSDGTAWSWGANGSGQLGDGTTAGHTIPTQILALDHGVAALGSSALANHSLFVGQTYANVSPLKLLYASAPEGSTSEEQDVTVTNDGLVPLAISATDIIGGDGDQFSKSGDGCQGVTLAVGASCTIGVRFKPSVPGSPLAYLRISSNSPTSPDNVELDPPAFRPPSAGGEPAPAPRGEEPKADEAPGPAPQTAAITASCGSGKAARGSVRVACRLRLPVGVTLRDLTARLERGGRVLASGRGAMRSGRVSFALKARRRVARGLHRLTLNVKDATGKKTALRYRIYVRAG